MQNPYAYLVLEQIILACSLLAKEFANINAIQASNESEKNKKCSQWQEILQQTDYALNFIEIEALSALLKIQKQVIAAVAKGDLASSTQLFTLLSKTQHAMCLLLEKHSYGWPILPINLFAAYKSLHQTLFQDEVSAAYLIRLPHENDLPRALQTLSQTEVTRITLQELIEMYESALLMLLKQESKASVKAATKKLAQLFSWIANHQKEKIKHSTHAVSNREQLYSQVFQLYAQKISEGENLDAGLARKIFSAMRRKIYQLSGDTKLTFRSELLQEVLFELRLNKKNDVSVNEVLQCFHIQQQFALLENSQSSWDELDTRSDAWNDFFHAVEQTKNAVLANYSLDPSGVFASAQLNYLLDAFENMIKLTSCLSESLENSLKNCRAWLDSSSVNEQEFNQLLAYLLLLEQIALNKQEWEFSAVGQSTLNIVLRDVEVDLSAPNQCFKLGRKSHYLEKRQAHHALLSGLQQGLVVLENKLDSVLIVGLIDNEEKIIRSILLEIISVLKFLNAVKLIQDFSILKDCVVQYIKHANDATALSDVIVEKFLLFEKEFSDFCLQVKNNDELVEPIFNIIENTEPIEEIKLEENENEVNQLEVNQLVINQIEKQLNTEELQLHQKSEQSSPVSTHALSLVPLPLIASPALQKIYLKEAQQLVAQLNTALQAWLLSPDEHLLQTAAHAAHSLAGSSATVGVSSMSALSTALEQVLQLLTDAAHADPITSDLLMQSATILAAQLHNLSIGIIPDSQLVLVEKLLTHRDRLNGELAAGGVTSLNVSSIDEVQAAYPAIDWMQVSSATPIESAVVKDEEINSLNYKSENEVQSIEEKFQFETEEKYDDESEEEPDEELVAIFIEEATDFLPELDAALRNWFDHPQNTESANAILRILHTLKGGARMAGCKALGQHFHQMETEVEQLTDAPNRDSEKIAQLLLAFDFAVSALAKLKNQAQRVDDALHTPLLNHQGGEQEPSLAIAAEAISATQESTLLRVRTDVMDRLAGSAAELIVDGARMSAEIQQQKKSLLDLTDTLMRLRSQLRELEFVAESSIASKMQAS